MIKSIRIAFRLGLMVGIVGELPTPPATAQTTSPKGSPARNCCPLWKLIGDDAKKAEELE